MHDLDLPPRGHGGSVTACLDVLVYTVAVQQHEAVLNRLPVRMLLQVTPGFPNNGNRVPAVSRSGVEMEVQPRFLAKVGEEPHKGAFALPLAADEDDRPGWDASATTYRLSAEPRNAAEHPRAVLGIETGVPTKSAYVLSAMHTGCAAAVLFDDEDLLLLQVVEQSDVVGRDK